ncbi:hypothetical protein KL932_003731 [Ogataea haglerorum]|nr:hypothetical protein KL950_001722 [Ogataea haglerorum]KAG7738838.1 hypothetical protein KL932_003731 [Ogataea haglerorum]KAG7759782.1 hypothetical protein KL947_002163 [Ogataea haglerorum]KAG7811527.1 hypothetical protein KL924_002193 [Ogataea haglerorum]
MTSNTNVVRKHLNLLDPFLTVLFNYGELSENSEIRTIIDKLVTSPHRYVILLPKTEKLLLINGSDTKVLDTLFSDRLFIQSHVIDTKTGKSLGNETSVSTMNNGLILFQNGKSLARHEDIEPPKNEVYTESLTYSTLSYLYPGYKLQICFIESPLVFPSGNKTCPDKVVGFQDIVKGKDGILEDDICEDFNDLMKDSGALADHIGPKFRELFSSFNVVQARTEGELMSLFLATIAKAVDIVRSLPSPTHSMLIKKFNEKSLHQAIYDYVEMNVYDKLWPRFLDLCSTPTDHLLNASYEVFQYMSISQLGLPDSVVEDTDLIQLLLGRVVKAISEIKMLDYSMTSSGKLNVLLRAINALSHDPSESNSRFIIDADTLLSLVILVLGTAGVTNVQCQVKYIKSYYPSPEKVQSGTPGYVISTIEAAVGYLTDDCNITSLSRQCRANEKLWKNICLSAEDPRWATFHKNLHGLQEHHLGNVNTTEMVQSLVGKALRSRNLKGESCLIMAIKHGSWPVFKTLIDLHEVYDLNFILTDTDNSGSTLLQLALIEGDSRMILELIEIISEATEPEIEIYCSKPNNSGRNLGHYLMYYKPLVPTLGTHINWRQVDCFHQTPLATIVRCYDHPDYQDLLEAVLRTVYEWYAKQNLSFDLKDHLDAKNNSLLHSFKDGRTLGYFLKLFRGLDLNYPNSQNLTPLMFSIKYNKFWNVYYLLNDERTDISKANTKNHLTAFDYIKTSMLQHSLLQESEHFSNSLRFRLKLLTVMSASLLRTLCPKHSIRSAVIITRRYDTDNDANLYLFLMSENSSEQKAGYFVRHKESEILKMLAALKLSRPYDFPQVRLSFLEQLRKTSNQHHSFGHMSQLLDYDRTSQLNLLLASLAMNEERGIDDELWKLLSKKTSLGSSNHSQRLSPAKQENSFTLTCEDLLSAQSFVKLTGNDLSRFFKICEMFFRQHALLGILWSDVERLSLWKPYGTKSSDEVGHIVHGSTGFKDIFNTSATILSMSKNATGEKLLDSLSFFLYSAKDLQEELKCFFDVYIKRILSLLNQVSDLQNHCRQLLQKAQQHSSFTSTSCTQLRQLAESIDKYLVESRYAYLKSADDHYVWHSSTINLPYKQSSMFGIFDLSRFSEKNRIMQTEKLEECFAAIKNNINGLAIKFRASYESINMELNNFYLFKKQFFLIVFKQFARRQIEMLKSQQNRLELDMERFLFNERT